jgi:hypothetical protein
VSSHPGSRQMKSVEQSCTGVKPDGTQCQAAALPDSDFCFFHDPSKKDERREAQAAGGRQNRAKTLDAETPDIKIRNYKDVVALLSQTIDQVRRGQIDPRVANSVGYLASPLVRALAQNELEDRIEKLERAVHRQPSIPESMITGGDKC